MALLAQRILGGLTPSTLSRTRPPATERVPDRILMGPKPGHTDSGLPPVRIYLGSERHQFRAERAFLWSVEKHRNPARSYEIFLMRELRGFSRGFWLTGFTNYRFAIPAFCGYKGRAIYNDADQIYLTDPAHLFDAPMEGAGFLSINDRDTSVMLIDCERMKDVWNEQDVRQKSRKQLEAAARKDKLWGDLDNEWNARDKEFSKDTSKLVHFTTLHTQPWRPFPSQLIYFDNPTHELWPQLEKDANNHRFLPFNAKRPSRHWAAVLLFLGSKEAHVPSLHFLRPEPAKPQTQPLEVSHLLEHIPDQDILWVLVRLLEASPSLTLRIQEPLRHAHGRFKRSLQFWVEHLELACEMAPQARWHLCYQESSLGSVKHYFGGLALMGDVAYLTANKPGHNAQAKALAEGVAEKLEVSLGEVALPTTLMGGLSLLVRQPRALPALPDSTTIVVAGGWLPTRIARRYQKKYPYLRLILSGRKAGAVPQHGGVVVQCAHFGLPPHPRRIETLVPVNLGQSSPCQNDDKWQSWRAQPKRLAVLLGGSTKSYKYTPSDIAVLAEGIDKLAQQVNGSVLLVGSRRSTTLLSELDRKLSVETISYAWKPNDPSNPYALALAHADHLIVTGESESMIADALSTGQPFSVFYAPHAPRRLFDQLAGWVATRAVKPTYNRRGSIRPQQGLQYLCARALERAWVLPPRALAALHEALYAQGYAVPLGQPVSSPYPVPPVLQNAIDQVIYQLKLSTKQ